ANERAQALNTSPLFTQDQLDQFQANDGTDWQDLVFRNAGAQQHQLSFSGGGDKTTYLISGNYVNQNGIIENTGYKRYSIRSNIHSKLTDDFSIRLNVLGSRIENHNTGLLAGTGNPLVQALAWAPTTPPYDDNGNFTVSDPTGSVMINPLALLYDRQLDNNRNQANIIGGMNYQLPIEGLALDLQYAINYNDAKSASFNGVYASRDNPNASRSSSEQFT